jgi:hypothetical protein
MFDAIDADGRFNIELQFISEYWQNSSRLM